MNIESKVYLDIARIWNVCPGEVEKMVRDYIGAVTCDFKPLKLYSKPRICIRPVKVKTLKERLEETKMKNDIYPLVVVLDRYNGTYSGGKWTAWNLNYVPWKIDADDTECADFFSKNTIVYGRGETPQEAIDDLKMILNCGIPDPDEEDEDEEEEKMEPTSVWRIEGINDIWINQDVNGMSLMLKNKDDLTKIMLSGEAIDNYNNTFTISLQADMIEYAKKMRKLKKENYELKAKSKDISDDNASLLETYKKLKKENEKLKEQIKKFEEPTDNVNHPSHYTGKYECIDVMQDVFGDKATNDFCLCNAFKYIWRARKKNGLEDVKKAVWYLNKYIEEAEKDGEDEVTRT